MVKRKLRAVQSLEPKDRHLAYLRAFGDYNNAKTCPVWDETLDCKASPTLILSLAITAVECKASLAAILKDVESDAEASLVHPETYSLPHELERLKQAMSKNTTQFYMLKPTDKQECDGVRPVRHRDLPFLSQLGKGWIVQNYITRPLLLAKRKFDLRLWLMITSTQPPRVRSPFFPSTRMRLFS